MPLDLARMYGLKAEPADLMLVAVTSPSINTRTVVALLDLGSVVLPDDLHKFEFLNLIKVGSMRP